jgi:hypothetical protein
MPLIFLLLIAGGAYFYFFMYDDFKWPKAKTPLEAVDLFNKAIKARDYKHAAKYCTKAYAELLVKGHDAASKLGTAIDNLKSRMNNDNVMTKEMDYVLAVHDPFSTSFTLAKASESEKEALATVDKPLPPLPTDTREQWTVPSYQFAFYRYFMRTNKFNLKIVKENDIWLIEGPSDKDTTDKVEQLVLRYRDYLNAFEVLSREIKVERTVKENVRQRMKELIDQASKAEQ